jgi:hypothetical protein
VDEVTELIDAIFNVSDKDSENQSIEGDEPDEDPE